MFDVLERAQRDIKEIARATGRIEDAKGGEPFDEGIVDRGGFGEDFRALGALGGTEQFFGGARGRAGNQGFDLRVRRRPFGQQRIDDHRLDDHHDLGAIGIMRAQLAALGRVQPAFE